jgi:hypothetical protein
MWKRLERRTREGAADFVPVQLAPKKGRMARRAGQIDSILAAAFIMPQEPKATERFDAFAEDLLAERSARPLVIVGASKIDSLLFDILTEFLLPKISKPREPDELLERDPGPLATFSSRIKICRRLGLIDESLYDALEQLRDLRNKSAHALAFDEARSPIRDKLAELKRRVAGRRSYKLTKDRYFGAASLAGIEECQCLLLTLCVVLESIRKKVRQTPGNKNALRIAAG